MLMVAIFAERSKEFVYEGKRLVRYPQDEVWQRPTVFISPNHPYGVLDKGTQEYKIL